MTDDDSPNAKFACLPIEFTKKTNSSNVQLPINNLELIDARADTSKIGFFHSPTNSQRMKLCLARGVKEEVGSFLNNYLKKNFTYSSLSLVLCMRKIWIGEYDTSVIVNGNVKVKLVFLKAEFYLKESDCFYPLYRFDSSILVQKGNNEKIYGAIEDILIASLGKALDFNYSNFKNKNCFSKASIDSFNSARINFPIIAGEYKKGVYLKFEDFRQNKPAFTDFEVKMDKVSDHLFVKGKRAFDSLIMDAWGYNDGERSYCQVMNNYFPLFRCGNNFDLYAPKDFIVKTPLPIYGFSVPNSSGSNSAVTGLILLGAGELLSMIKASSIKLRPFQLDIETGKFY